MDNLDAIDDQQATAGGEGHVSLPSSPADRKRMKTMLSEATYCKQRIDDERQSIKDIVGRIHEEFQLPKKLVTKLISTLYKQDYANRVAEEEDFQFLYEAIVHPSANDKAADKADEEAKLNEIKAWLRERGTDPESDEEQEESAE